MKQLYFLIPLTILLFSLFAVVYSEDYYLDHASEVEYYEEEVGNLLGYFKGGGLDTTRYSEKEIVHLKDVRKLIYVGLSLLLVLLLVNVWSFSKVSVKLRKRVLVKSGVYACASFASLALALWLAFDLFFRLFHEIFFFNDYWMLPADSTLIQMFPQSFFYSAVSSIILYSIVLSLLFIVAGCIISAGKKDGRT
tara:strand:- start:871 stop:1452 length:582 start_codon:yes stop_codon:yes gene_type:complete